MYRHLPHQDSAGTAPIGTPPPAQLPPPPQTRRTQSHSTANQTAYAHSRKRAKG